MAAKCKNKAVWKRKRRNFEIEKYTYDVWGNLISITDLERNPVSDSYIASRASVCYRGYVYDTETGLYYLQSRYYDPEVGRFLNADDVDYIGLAGTDVSYNAFAYCGNNPVNNSDPFGTLYLNWRRTVGLGIFFVLLRLGFLGSDIKGINSITKNRVHTALVTALVYSKYYISAEIISYICNVATAVAVLNTIISLITFAMTGPVGAGVKGALRAISGLAVSYLIPGFVTSIKMIYYGYRNRRGSYLYFRWTGIAVYF